MDQNLKIENLKTPIVFLHGFLGSPSEFGPVVEHLAGQQIFLPDLYTPGPLDPTHSFAQWVTHFTDWLDSKAISKPWVVGYSMGGRLALHLATLAPGHVRGVTAVSAHPGIENREAQTQRAQWEAQWLKIFQNESFAEAIKQWQAQEVFTHSERAVVDPHLDPRLVAASMTNWSTARHAFSSEQLLKPICPVSWVVGRRDTKYLELLTAFLRGRPSDLTVIEEAAHRVHLDAPKALAQVLNRLTVELTKK